MVHGDYCLFDKMKLLCADEPDLYRFSCERSAGHDHVRRGAFDQLQRSQADIPVTKGICPRFDIADDPAPAYSLLLIGFTDLPPAIKVGFIILSACPGGTTSGFVTVLFRGNVALSVSLITINSLITLVTIPLLVNLALTVFTGRHSPFELPLVQTFLQIFFVTLLPAFTGVLLRYYREKIADRIQKPVRTVMIVLFAGVYTLIAFADESKGGSGITFPDLWSILPYAVIINLAGFAAGMVMGLFGKTGIRTSWTIGVEVALQNTTLALLVAGTLIQSNEMVKPALVYALFSSGQPCYTGLLSRNTTSRNYSGNSTEGRII